MTKNVELQVFIITVVEIIHIKYISFILSLLLRFIKSDIYSEKDGRGVCNMQLIPM